MELATMVAHPKNARSDGLKCPDVGSWAETKYRPADLDNLGHTQS